MKLSSSLNEMKKWILLVLIGVVAYWGLNNFDVIGKGLGKLYAVFSPFILGFVLAYTFFSVVVLLDNTPLLFFS